MTGRDQSRRENRQQQREPEMYERILAAIDHSEISDRVLAAARDLALLAKGQVWVLHLQEREVIPRMGLVRTESDQAVEDEVTAAVEKLTKEGVTAHGIIRDTIYGHAAKEIMADAKEHDTGVIVMGSRGRGDLTGAILGSTAHKVIHLSDRPVLVVR
jgi:nucleotide-binding universal stress UspA family protein